MSDTTEHDAQQPGGGDELAQAAVLDAVCCARCGYPLAGLGADGVCPECGLAVRVTREGSVLCDASLSTLQALHRGSVLVMVGIVFLVVSLLAFVVVEIIGLPARPVGSSRSVPLGPVLSVLLLGAASFAVGACAAGLTGRWMLTTPDDGHSSGSRGDRARLIARWTAVIAVLSTLAFTFGVVYVALSGWLSLAFVYISATGSLVACMIAQFFLARFVMLLARCLPSKRVEQRARRLMWLVPLLLIVGFYLWLYGTPLLVTGLLACSVWLLAAMALHFHLMSGLRKALKEIIESKVARPAAGNG